VCVSVEKKKKRREKERERETSDSSSAVVRTDSLPLGASSVHDAFEFVGDQIQFLHAQYICLAPIHILRREGGREKRRDGARKRQLTVREGAGKKKVSLVCVR